MPVVARSHALLAESWRQTNNNSNHPAKAGKMSGSSERDGVREKAFEIQNHE